MAFARAIGQPRRSVEAQMIKAQLAEAAPALVAWEAQKQKLVSAKDLKKLRKQINEKMQNALAVKSEMGSVQEQLKTLSHAVDALSQILVDELDAVGADMRQTKVETSDQLTTLAKGMQAFTHGLSGLKATSDQCKSTAEAASTSISKLKRWTETGFRRLNEALTVQQQALTVLDSQISGFNERMHDGHADLVNCRQESADCKAEFERMRTQVSQVVLSNEKLVQEYRDHIRIMQTATSNCEMATAEQESRTTMQQQEISHVEALLHEHRAICEGARG
jgi:chromosome segregation ATPase